MKHIEYYEADDGTRFDDELDCEAYESNKRFADIDAHIKAFDDDFVPIKIGSIDDESWQCHTEYFIIYSDRGFDYLSKCEDWTGIRLVHKPCENPNYPLFLRYEEDNCYGLDITKERNKWCEIYEKLKYELIKEMI